MAKQQDISIQEKINAELKVNNGVINPIAVVDVVGQSKSTGYPSQGLTGVVLDSPSDGWEMMAIAGEDLIYGQPAFIIKCPPERLAQPSAGNMVYVSQKYNATYANQYVAENLVMVLQSYKNQLSLQYGTSIATNVALSRQPLEFTVGRMSVIDNVRLQLSVYSMQDNISAQPNARLYVLKSSLTQLFPVYILNNDPTVVPDPALYIRTNFISVSILKQIENINAGTTLVEFINTL